MKYPSISVVMPVYNGERYLKEAIDSILNQTFKDFEFIIINDGSTDKTEQIILSYKDDRLRYYHKQNTGISDTLKFGVELSNGKYIARMDADDISNPNRFQMQFDFLEKNIDYVLVGSSVNYIDEDGNFIGRSIPYTNNFAIKRSLEFGSTIVHPSAMYTRVAYFKTHGYNCEIKGLYEDYVLWIDMSMYGKFYNIIDPLLSYRISNNSWYFKINQKELKKAMTETYWSIKKNKYDDIGNIYKLSLPYIFSNNNENELKTIDKFHSHIDLFLKDKYFLSKLFYSNIRYLKFFYSYIKHTIK